MTKDKKHNYPFLKKRKQINRQQMGNAENGIAVDGNGVIKLNKNGHMSKDEHIFQIFSDTFSLSLIDTYNYVCSYNILKA